MSLEVEKREFRKETPRDTRIKPQELLIYYRMSHWQRWILIAVIEFTEIVNYLKRKETYKGVLIYRPHNVYEKLGILRNRGLYKSQTKLSLQVAQP